MNSDVELKGNFFQQTNALIFRGKTQHQIANLTTTLKNIELKVIVISKQGTFKTKKGEIAQFLVADETGCCYMNFFNETGQMIELGDCLYISGAYTSFYKESLLIYEGSSSIIRRIGRWYCRFNLANNISLVRHPGASQQSKK